MAALAGVKSHVKSLPVDEKKSIFLFLSLSLSISLVYLFIFFQYLINWYWIIFWKKNVWIENRLKPLAHMLLSLFRFIIGFSRIMKKERSGFTQLFSTINTASIVNISAEKLKFMQLKYTHTHNRWLSEWSFVNLQLNLHIRLSTGFA